MTILLFLIGFVLFGLFCGTLWGERIQGEEDHRQWMKRQK